MILTQESPEAVLRPVQTCLGKYQLTFADMLIGKLSCANIVRVIRLHRLIDRGSATNCGLEVVDNLNCKLHRNR